MSASTPTTSAPPRRGRRQLRILAWILVIGSFPVWFALFAVPLLPLPPAQQIGVAGGLALAGEVMFWVGGAILGGPVIARFRKPRVRTGRSFRDTSAAVVGATGGLGAAIVDALRREGASVVALGRDTGQLAALRSRHPDVTTGHCDVTSADSIDAAARLVPPLDVVVVATGLGVRKALSEQSPDDVHAQVATNLAGFILAVRAFAPRMRDGATIVVLGGYGDGGLGLPYHAVDAATRAGVATFAQAMNREFALEGRGVRIAYACPAPADTPAERPYLALWRDMNTRVVSAAKVADFVLVAARRRRGMAVMGWQNGLIARVNRSSPALADAVALRRVGVKLREALGAVRIEIPPLDNPPLETTPPRTVPPRTVPRKTPPGARAGA